MQREEFSHGVADPFYREAFHKTAEVIAGLCTELSTETELSTGNGKNELQKEKMEGEKRKRDIPPRPPIESKGKEEGEKKDPPSSARSACVCACVREDTREADAVFDDFWAKYPTGFKVAKKRCRDKVRSRYRAAKDKAQFVNAFLGGLDRWLACQRWSEGIICNPMYSNPSGVTYSDAKVRALAELKTAAPDFRIIWDHAYCVHHLYDEPERQDRLANIYEACCAAGCPDRVLMFASTSKITFAGCGISAMAASPANIARHTELLHYQLVSYDRMNQLRHVRFLKDRETVAAHMEKHAAIIRPKFELVLRTLERELSGLADWSHPRGGYFILFEAPEGCAKRIVELCGQAGVTLTPAGSPFVGGFDPRDSVLRIAPTLPPMEELEQVMEIFPVCVKLAAAEAGAL